MWTVLLDEGSMKELKKLNMAPYFAMDRLRFRHKGGGHEWEANKNEMPKYPESVHLQGNKEHELPKAQMGSTTDVPTGKDTKNPSEGYWRVEC